jgi:hypothetical protein
MRSVWRARGVVSIVLVLVAAPLQSKAFAFVFPAGPPAPKPTPVDPTLQGLWTVSGSPCGKGGANVERVRVTQDGDVATAVTLTGDACVPAGGVVWTAKVPPRPAPGVPYVIPVELRGLPPQPNAVGATSALRFGGNALVNGELVSGTSRVAYRRGIPVDADFVDGLPPVASKPLSRDALLARYGEKQPDGKVEVSANVLIRKPKIWVAVNRVYDMVSNDPRSDGHAAALRIGAREILLFTAGPECCVQTYAYDATNDEAAVLLLPGATATPGPVTPWLYGEPDAKVTSVLVQYFQAIAGPLRPVARSGWEEDPAATAAALLRASQDEVRAGRAPRTVDEALEQEQKRNMRVFLGLIGATAQPALPATGGDLPETFPARKVVSMPGFIHLVVPAGFHARATDAAQLSVARIGQEANEAVHFNEFPFARAGTLQVAANMMEEKYATIATARGGDYREEKRAAASCGGGHPGIRIWLSIRMSAGAPVSFVRSCVFFIDQKAFVAGYMVTGDRIAAEGPLLDAIMKSAAFGDDADTQRP